MDSKNSSKTNQKTPVNSIDIAVSGKKSLDPPTFTCPSCSFVTHLGAIEDLPLGWKFDPTDQEILQHLRAKVNSNGGDVHPSIDEFILTINGENGICYTHPDKLPGLSVDGQVRHFFHRPSKAYTTGTRKRRKVLTNEDGSETRWHKTGKTRPVMAGASVMGYKKIMVLYTNFGRQRKPEKTNWVMHQYHLGDSENEKEGELVASKIFYLTQPRQRGSIVRDRVLYVNGSGVMKANAPLFDCYGEQYISKDERTTKFQRI